MRIQTLIKTVAAVGALALASAAQAGSISYLLDDGGSAFGSSVLPIGTVTLSDSVTGTVIINVKLSSGYVFVDTGSHEYFSFNTSGLSVTVNNPILFFGGSYTATLNNSPGTNSPFSTFEHAIVCTSCKGTSAAGNELQFSLTGSGLTLASFRDLSTGAGTSAYFAADIFGPSSLGGGNTTGVAGARCLAANDCSVKTVPEPTSIALMGLGLAAVGFARRRKVAA